MIPEFSAKQPEGCIAVVQDGEGARGAGLEAGVFLAVLEFYLGVCWT